MELVFDSLEQGLSATPQFTSREQALALMALLAGGAMMSRAVADPTLSEEIGAAVQKLANSVSAPKRTEAQERHDQSV